jgi:hypothetical protein
MTQTIRKYWGAFNGRVTLNYNWPAIDHDSVVVITASEYGNDGVRFVGAASITVANISPHGPPYDPNHGVTFVVNVAWGSPLNLVTDITLFNNKPIETQTYVPAIPHNLGMRMQYQETTEWCWIAVAVSVSHFYNPSSPYSQCQVMTTVGQNINGFPSDTSACPSADAYAKNFGLGAILGDPYNPLALYILDNPDYGVDRNYIKSGGVSDPLKVTGNWASNQAGDIGLGKIADEINAGRPVIAAITWNSGGSHYVAISGVQGDSILILDPINGQSIMPFADFPATYFGGAKLDMFVFTKSAS